MKRENKLLLSLGAISAIALPVTSLVSCGLNSYQKYVDSLHNNLKIYYSKVTFTPDHPYRDIVNVYLFDSSNLLLNGLNNNDNISLSIISPFLPYPPSEKTISGSITYEKYKLDPETLKIYDSSYHIDDKNFPGFYLGYYDVSSIDWDYNSLPDGTKATITFTPINSTTKFDPATGKPENYNPPTTMTFTIQIIHP